MNRGTPHNGPDRISHRQIDRIDPQQIARIVREVLTRLKSLESVKAPTAACLQNERVVTAETIEQIQDGTTEARLSATAVVTPAAKDEARRRGIKITRVAVENKTETTTINLGSTRSRDEPRHVANDARYPVSAPSDPQRAGAIVAQLSRRGTPPLPVPVLISDTPAAEVHRQCASFGRRAAMVGAIADVERFAAELDPNVWVLDSTRLNFAATMNVVARIAMLHREAS